MPNRWDHTDRVSLQTLTSVPADTLRAHAEHVVANGPDAWDLYRRWENQHWTVTGLDLEQDRPSWDALPESAREVLLGLLTSFYVGEYTAVDGLGAVMAGVPEESELVFLATQTSDEARHVALMEGIDQTLTGGEGGLKQRLPALWNQLTPGYRAMQRIEDRYAAEVMRRPDTDSWLRLVSVFHLLTEGVLAINGQQAVLRTLRAYGSFPQLEMGFIGMMRDESRHIAYGTQAARRWVSRGFEEHVIEAMEEAIPHVVHIDDSPGKPPNPVAARQITSLIDRRLRSVGLSAQAREHLSAVARRPYDPHATGTDRPADVPVMNTVAEAGRG